MAEEINLDDLKRIIEEGSKKKKEDSSAHRAEKKKVIQSAEEIVERIKKRYEEEGMYLREDTSTPEINVSDLLSPELSVSGSPDDLSRSENEIIRFFGNVYVRFRGFFDAILKRIADSKMIKKLEWYLYAVGWPFTGIQYLALILVASVLVSVLAFFLSIPLALKFTSGFVAAILPIAVAFFVFMLVYVIGKSYPASVAQARSRVAEKYLPFALRHLAVEIRAGMGLYQALKAVADAKYGVLSEEISRTLREIDEGKSMEVVLSNLARRMRTKGMQRAVANILRALHVGGSLSDTIMEIAREVSFEQRMRVAEYGEKLNFYSVIFMFVAIVFPIMIAMLAAIGGAPVGGGILQSFRQALTPTMLRLLYAVAFPGFLLLFLYFIRISDPMR